MIALIFQVSIISTSVPELRISEFSPNFHHIDAPLPMKCAIIAGVIMLGLVPPTCLEQATRSRKRTSSEKTGLATLPGRKSTGAHCMFRYSKGSGRRTIPPMPYIRIPVPPDRYRQALLVKHLSTELRPATLGPRHSSCMARSIIFPSQGGIRR